MKDPCPICGCVVLHEIIAGECCQRCEYVILRTPTDDVRDKTRHLFADEADGAVVRPTILTLT